MILSHQKKGDDTPTRSPLFDKEGLGEICEIPLYPPFKKGDRVGKSKAFRL